MVMTHSTESRSAEEIRATVRSKYAAGARIVLSSGSCCGGSNADACCNNDVVTSSHYSVDEANLVPADALAASLGCGNPTALAALEPGQSVLDLGSGGGIDVLLSARRVGPTGFAYGLDMTDEMLALAEKNRLEAGATNVEFLKGDIEDIPLPDNKVDVIISNCVINLAADKAPVLSEAFRVLKPGGRFAVSDVVTQGELPADLRSDMEAWVGCVAGALEEQDYRRLLSAAGFEDIDIQVTRVYDPRELSDSLRSGGCCGPAQETTSAWNESAYARFDASGGRVVSAFVRARKPDA
jgi:ubiquinone/menaquinone biosynthesis C-methylase UbiE